MHTVEITQIRILAAKEFRDRIRNRWVIAVAIIFTLFALAISYFGSAQQGSVCSIMVYHSFEVSCGNRFKSY